MKARGSTAVFADGGPIHFLTRLPWPAAEASTTNNPTLRTLPQRSARMASPPMRRSRPPPVLRAEATPAADPWIDVKLLDVRVGPLDKPV